MDDLQETTTATVTKPYDNVGGKYYPRIKMAFGVDGTANDVSASNPLPVTSLGSGTTAISGTIPISGTVNLSGTIPVSGTTSVSGTVPVSGSVDARLADKIAGEDLIKDVMKIEGRFGNNGPISASGTVLGASGRFSGFICTSSNSGVIRFWNGGTVGTKILDSLAVSAGQAIQIPGGATSFSTNLYFELVSGTATITPFFNS